jgi:hypothetical protein
LREQVDRRRETQRIRERRTERHIKEGYKKNTEKYELRHMNKNGEADGYKKNRARDERKEDRQKRNRELKKRRK